jgi:hypothetical protein
MATDAVVVQFPGLVEIEAVEEVTTLAQFAPLQPGRSYLVWACGYLQSRHALIAVELEAFDAKHRIQLREGTSPYSLAVGTTLPADDDLFTAAKVSARIDAPDVLGDPFFQHPSVDFLEGRLVVLAVDTLAVQGPTFPR